MTQNSQLSQKSFKTCLRKLTIIPPFIHRNNLLFYFLINTKNFNFFLKRKKRRKKSDILFLEIAPKKVSRGTPSTLSTPSKWFEEDEAEETSEKKIKNPKKNPKKIKKNFF